MSNPRAKLKSTHLASQSVTVTVRVSHLFSRGGIRIAGGLGGGRGIELAIHILPVVTILHGNHYLVG
jgi:hypothetical protein